LSSTPAKNKESSKRKQHDVHGGGAEEEESFTGMVTSEILKL
jgi:hypothetical protein